MLGGCGQQLDVHAGLEHAPGGREAAAAEQSGQRPGELGGRLHLQPLVHVDDPAGRVPRGVHGRHDGGIGMPHHYRRLEPGLLHGLVDRLGDAVHVIRLPAC